MENKERRYAIIIITVFAVIIGGLAVVNLFYTPPHILLSERRVRERRPVLSAQTLRSGDFMDGFEGYAADAFPFREGFRALRAATVYGVFLQTDKEGIYHDTHDIGSFTRTDTTSVALLADKIAAVADTLDEMNLFFGVIPDKSAYAARHFPGFDTAVAEEILTARLEGFTMLPVSEGLSAGSFYRTDLHWCQASIGGAVDLMGVYMGFTIYWPSFEKRRAGTFRGGYAGQFALPVRPEGLYYLYNPDLRAYYMNMGTRQFEAGPVYDLALFGGLDPYDIFLRGAQPLVVIENDNAVSQRVLYIFRDSFASSLAPLLAQYYTRVVLIDFRFISLRTLHTLIDFTPGADALFLYSAGIVNNAEGLMVY